MARGIGGAVRRSVIVLCINWVLRYLPQPRFIAALEALGSILLLECPPSCHARQLAPTKTVELAVRCDGGHEIEEVEDDALAGTILHTDGDERLEGVSRHVGVFMGG